MGVPSVEVAEQVHRQAEIKGTLFRNYTERHSGTSAFRTSSSSANRGWVLRSAQRQPAADRPAPRAARIASGIMKRAPRTVHDRDGRGSRPAAHRPPASPSPESQAVQRTGRSGPTPAPQARHAAVLWPRRSKPGRSLRESFRGCSPLSRLERPCTRREFAELRAGCCQWRRRELNPRPRSRERWRLRA
jgi:hypothetical protein